MNPKRLIISFLCVILCGRTFAQTADIDTELGSLAEKLATQIQDHGKKKVAVIDFTDLQGGSSELGKYIAEQLSVNLVIGKRDFSVLDRANLKSILAEHKLTATGLIDPENAKKLGMFAGVDALILGTIIPKTQSVSLTAKIITTDTAEIVGAARAQFKTDENVQQLLAKSATQIDNVGGSTMGTSGESTQQNGDDSAKVVKIFGDMRVEFQSLQVINGGQQYLLTFAVANQSTAKSIWVAVSTSGMSADPHATVRDSNGYDFVMDTYKTTGIVVAGAIKDFQAFATSVPLAPDRINQATEIRPGNSVVASIRFYNENRVMATAGKCSLQMDFLTANNFRGGSGDCTTRSIFIKLNAE